MSVPHMDFRNLDGEPALFFGPFATFSSKFLKEGSWTDLFGSITFNNVWPTAQVGMHNFNLVRYLVGQVMMSDDDRFDALQDFYPQANPDDWTLWTAGQRVQIIKNDPDEGGKLQFGTEVVSAEDGSIAALLGASPGASTSPTIMLRLLENVFAEQVASDEWQEKLLEIVPSYGQRLSENPELLREMRAYTAQTLALNEPMNSVEQDTDALTEVENAEPESEATDAGSESSAEQGAAESEAQNDEAEEVAL